jgi:pyruvate formate lyase activating enzyme
LDIVGKPISVEKAVDEVLRDSFLYQRGGGGACISGGEPMLQAKFTIDFLKACQDQLIDTAIETCCYADWDGLEQAAPYVDLFLVDIKHMDSAMHKTGTGVDNRRILENIERLAQMGKKIRVRLPIIPEYNDSEENLRATANFMLKNDITHIDLLGFHATGGFKYDKLGKDYAHANTAEPTPAEMEAHMALFRDFGIEGTIGGTDIDAF